VSEKLKILRVRKNPNDVVPYVPAVVPATRPKPKPRPEPGTPGAEPLKAGPKKRRRRKKKTFFQKHVTQRPKRRKKPGPYYVLQIFFGELRQRQGSRPGKEKWTVVDSGYWDGDKLTKDRKAAERFPTAKDAKRVGKIIARNYEGVVAVMAVKIGK